MVMISRPDDPIAIMKHKDRFYGGKALIVLGGDSGKNWRKLRADLKADVVLGANGTCLEIKDLDYHLIAENMTRAAKLAARGDERQQGFMRIITEPHHAEFRLLSHRSWNLRHLMNESGNCISIRRWQWSGATLPDTFSFREYGEGFLTGWISRRPDTWRASVKVRVGTVAVQLLHLAGILGCFEVHTVGFDLCSKRVEADHWYADYPRYQADRFRSERMFVTYKGLRTQQFWIETATFLKSIEPFFERDNLEWHDHSDGLLKVMGLKCAM